MTSFTSDALRSNRRFVLLLAALGVLLVAVMLAVPGWNNLRSISPVGDPTPQTLWEAQALDSYRYTLQVSCFCLVEMTRPVTVEVRDGAVVSLTYADDGSPADAALFERYDSVEDLFAILAEAAAQNPARMEVTYADETGVPLAADIDISEQVADEEIRFTVAGFEALD